MQLSDLTKPIEEQTDEELMERLRAIRHNRNSVRPAAKAHAKRESKKGMQGRMSAIEKLLAGMSEEERLAILEELGEGDE